MTREAASPTSAHVQTPPTVTPEAAWAIEDAYHSFGNPDAGVVVVNSQGGPMPALVRKREILEKLGLLNLERIHLVNVHQAQTINPAPFTAADITFDEAKAADGESVEVLAALVDHFQAQGKTVYVVGISFGAFMVQELLATQGNVAEGYLIANGRLDMPPTIWTVFAEGRTVGFVDGVEIEDPRTGGHEPAPEGTVPLQRNMARLTAATGIPFRDLEQVTLPLHRTARRCRHDQRGIPFRDLRRAGGTPQRCRGRVPRRTRGGRRSI